MYSRSPGSSPWLGTISCGVLSLSVLSAQAATTGGLSGVVRDVETNQPLAGVNVILTPGPISTVTGPDGAYLFTGIAPGEYTLATELVSHQPAVETVQIVQDVTTPLDLELSPVEREAPTLSVRATSPQRSRSSTIYGVTRQEEDTVRGTPALLRQYPGDLQGQPGVILDPQGRLHIRGGRTEHTAYFLDGILVTEPNTNGFATNLSTVGLDRFNLFTGGISSEYGLALSGLANALIRRGGSLNGTNLNIEGGENKFGSLYLEHGGETETGTDWYLGGYTFRSRFPNDPSIRGVPAFADGVAKVTTRLGDNDRLAFFGGKGYARYDTTLGPFFTTPGREPTDANFARHALTWDRRTHSPVALNSPEGDYSTQGYSILSATWNKRFGADQTLNTQISRVTASGTAQFLSPVNRGYATRSSDMLSLRSDYDGRISRGVRLRGGLWVRPSDNDQYLVDTAVGPRPVRVDPVTGTRAQVGARVRHEDVDSTDAAAYTELEITTVPRLTLNLGLRHELRRYDRKLGESDLYIHPATAADPYREPTAADSPIIRQALERQRADRALLGDKTDRQTSPRLGASYQTDPDGVLRLFWGRYVLFAPASVLEQKLIPANEDLGPGVPVLADFWLKTQRQIYNLDPERSSSYDLSYERRFGFGSLSVSPYWRRQSNLIQRRVTPAGLTEFVNEGDGRMTGVEWKVNVRERAGWSGWLSYTWGKATGTHASTYAFASDPTRPNERFRLDWDQRHTLALAARKRTGKWEISPVLRYGSGFPYGTLGGAGYNPSGFAGWAGGDPRFLFDPSGTFFAVPILGPDGEITSASMNAYETNPHFRMDLTVRRSVGADRSVYISVQNLFNSRAVLARGLFDPFTRTLRGYNAPTAEYPQGYYTNDVTAREAPRFIAVGWDYRF